MRRESLDMLGSLPSIPTTLFIFDLIDLLYLST